MMVLKMAWTATLFTLGLVHTGSWKAAVLDQWSMSCTLWPHPAPYPFAIQRLANGTPSVQGVKELFFCAADPNHGFLPPISSKRTALGSSPTNRSDLSDLGSAAIPPKKSTGPQ